MAKGVLLALACLLQSSPRLSDISSISQTVSYLRVPSPSIADEDIGFQDLLRNRKGMSYVLLVQIKTKIEKTRLAQAVRSPLSLGAFLSQTFSLGWSLRIVTHTTQLWDQIQQPLETALGKNVLNEIVISALSATALLGWWLVSEVADRHSTRLKEKYFPVMGAIILLQLSAETCLQLKVLPPVAMMSLLVEAALTSVLVCALIVQTQLPRDMVGNNSLQEKETAFL